MISDKNKSYLCPCGLVLCTRLVRTDEIGVHCDMTNDIELHIICLLHALESHFSCFLSDFYFFLRFSYIFGRWEYFPLMDLYILMYILFSSDHNSFFSLYFHFFFEIVRLICASCNKSNNTTKDVRRQCTLPAAQTPNH